jgi:hypothetical protein
MKPIRFHWDNIHKHSVSANEVLECLASKRPKYVRKARRGVYLVVAQTAAGRYLEILFEDRPEERFVFHAMTARPAWIRLVKKRGKRR